MANIDNGGLKRDITHQGTWGNKSSEHRNINSAPNIADVLRFMTLPRGAKILDAHLVHGDFGVGVTCKVGIEPVSGAGATTDAIFAAATSIAAAGDKRMAKAPFVLTEDCYITLTTAGANAGGAKDADLTIDYEFLGV
jgi:hypothetical protein